MFEETTINDMTLANRFVRSATWEGAAAADGATGYAGEAPCKVMLAAGYKPHVRPRGEEQRGKLENPSFKARRWVVEACHSWFNRFRKLTIRYEKLGATH